MIQSTTNFVEKITKGFVSLFAMEETIGDRARRLLESLDMSQSELARRINQIRPDLKVTQQVINNLVTNKTRHPHYLAPLAGALGVDQHWLETGEGDPLPPVRVLGTAGASGAAARHRRGLEQELSSLISRLDPSRQEALIQLLRGLLEGDDFPARRRYAAAPPEKTVGAGRGRPIRGAAD